MFSETRGSRKAIGDVDVLFHEGIYHLFHLVLPNHDFIAHAVSTDGLNWRRVSNALFIGDPGSWDDLMIWTMHVSADPYQTGRWRMFYTGLSRCDQGRIQRIGLALSDDLYHWEKAPVNWSDLRGPDDPPPIKTARRASEFDQPSERHAIQDRSSHYPLQADPRYYESSLKEGRHWVSFRDPFFYHDNENGGWLLIAGRVNDGPVIRRGCVAALHEVAPNQFEAHSALHYPGLYDDIEVPNVFQIEQEYYLIGSIREDSKIRYWHTDHIQKPWRSYHDNVLMAAGNYAARIMRDAHGYLLWNFYSMDPSDRTISNLMPPPKRIYRTEDGLLRLKTFEEFENWVSQRLDTRCVGLLKKGLGQERCSIDSNRLELESEAGFQAFVFEHEIGCFRFRATIDLQGMGKCGIVFRMNPETHDGYYLSLDFLKGVAQLRSWRTGAEGSGEDMMQFRSLQSNYWHNKRPGHARVQLLAFGSYLEFSIDGAVILSLVDQTFRSGLLGVYLETAHLILSEVELNQMQSPNQSDMHLVTG